MPTTSVISIFPAVSAATTIITGRRTARRSARIATRATPSSRLHHPCTSGGPSMSPRSFVTGARVITLAVLVWGAAGAVVAGGGPSLSAQGGPNRAIAPGAAQAQGAGFVGDDTCVACHESEGKSLGASLHGKAQNARTPAAKS